MRRSFSTIALVVLFGLLLTVCLVDASTPASKKVKAAKPSGKLLPGQFCPVSFPTKPTKVTKPVKAKAVKKVAKVAIRAGAFVEMESEVDPVVPELTPAQIAQCALDRARAAAAKKTTVAAKPATAKKATYNIRQSDVNPNAPTKNRGQFAKKPVAKPAAPVAPVAPAAAPAKPLAKFSMGCQRGDELRGSACPKGYECKGIGNISYDTNWYSVCVLTSLNAKHEISGFCDRDRSCVSILGGFCLGSNRCSVSAATQAILDSRPPRGW